MRISDWSSDVCSSDLDRKRAVAFDRDGETARVQRAHQRVVDLQHRLAAGQHDIAVLAALAPVFGDDVGERRGAFIFAAQRPVGADEIGVAELTDRLGAILLAPRPQIAAGEAAEDRAAARLRALARSEEHTSELPSLMRISY